MAKPPVFHQSPRERKLFFAETIQIEEPATAPNEPATEISDILIPIGMTVFGLLFVVVVSTLTSNSTYILFSLGISVPLMLGTYIVTYLRYRREKRGFLKETTNRKNNYENMLEKLASDLSSAEGKNREILEYYNPTPMECLQEIVSCYDPQRLWSRAPSDVDFLSLRVGIGAVPNLMHINPPEQSALNPDPLIDAARSLKEEFKNIRNAPVNLPLYDAGIIGIAGPQYLAYSTVRTILFNLITHHSPADVKIVALYSKDDADSWSWLRWLPHLWTDDRFERYIACDANSAKTLLNSLEEKLLRRIPTIRQSVFDEIKRPIPAYVFLISDASLIRGHSIQQLLDKGRDYNIYTILIAESIRNLRNSCRAWVNLRADKPTLHIGINSNAVEDITYSPDRDEVTVELADRVARMLAPLRLPIEYSTDDIPRMVTLLRVLGVDKVEELNIRQNWQSNDPYYSMSVPIGLRKNGELQYLDFHEDRNLKPDIRYAHGPHGLVAGIPGSGKGELLQTLITSIATRFHPEQVNFCLFDFKMGATSKPVKKLPHVVNEITNEHMELVPRAIVSLVAELNRREKLIIKEAGVSHIDDYQELYRNNKVSQPLPYLIIIVDEFRVLKEAYPDLMSALIEIAAKGRFAGMPLLLVNQQLAGIVDNDIQKNTFFRICLKVADENESSTILARPEASDLRGNGQAYIQLRNCDPWKFEKIQVAWANAPYSPESSANTPLLEVNEVALNGERLRTKTYDSQGRQLDAIITHIVTQAEQIGIKRSQKIWKAPLKDHIVLDQVRPEGGWDGRSWKKTARWLNPVIGQMDVPVDQAQPRIQINLGQTGHLYITSGDFDQSRLVLRTIITSLVRDHSPKELNLYCLDFGSFGLRIFESLPHMGAILSKGENKRIRRLFSWLETAIESRRRWRINANVESLAVAHQRGNIPSTPPAIVVFIDNIAAIIEEMDLQEQFETLIREGKEEGIHFVITGDTTIFYKLTVRELINERLALQLDSQQSYQKVLGGDNYPHWLSIPKRGLGRGLFKSNRVWECQIATPTMSLDGANQNAEIASLVADMANYAREVHYQKPWDIPVLPKLVRLEEINSIDDIRANWSVNQEDQELNAYIALDEWNVEPVKVSLKRDGPHFLITGPPQSGKTTALKTWLLALATQYSTGQVHFILLDTFKEKLADIQSLPHVESYAATKEEYSESLKRLHDLEKDREKTNERWPAIIVAIDDSELLDFSTADFVFERISRGGALGIHFLLVSSITRAKERPSLINNILQNSSGMILGSTDLEQDAYRIFNWTLSKHQPKKMPPGQAFLFRRGYPLVVQIAFDGEAPNENLLMQLKTTQL